MLTFQILLKVLNLKNQIAEYKDSLQLKLHHTLLVQNSVPAFVIRAKYIIAFNKQTIT